MNNTHKIILILLLSSQNILAQYTGNIPISDLNDEQVFTVEGIDENDWMGRSVSTAGDFNGDGIDDIVVGKPGGSNDRAYVIYGGSFQADNPINPNLIDGGNGFSVIGSPGTGISVSSAGDFNGDGIDDLLVAANYSLIGEDAIAYVLYGNTLPMLQTVNLNQLSSSEGIKFNRPMLNETPGFVVSQAGDFNNDGFDDIMIGSIWSDDGATDSGTTFVVYGTNTLALNPFNLDDINGSNGTAIYGAVIDDTSGFQLDGAGDFNGDMIDDILISAAGAADDYKGHVFLIYGSQFPTYPIQLSTINGSNGTKFVGTETDDFAGIGLSGNIDFNADGLKDIIIGAPYARDDFGSNVGRAYVIYGSETPLAAIYNLGDLDINTGVIINGFNPSGFAGKSVASVGDFNGDRIDDLVVGAGAFNDTGWAYLIYGRVNPPAQIDAFPLVDAGFLLRGGSDDRFGDDVSAAGDFNNDGIADVIIGAWTRTVGITSDVGKAYVIYGNDTIFKADFQANE
ncbi:integrin alpha [Marinicella sp. S1101]|uniref:integrin alpha n=1 Tax=Marinicella marina TaxID=2996016 RepID=UPI002260FC80|nr:integrin alpha [Marinicella marina]MCX7552543.1 integrin alpha [Marinicella marina]MDJ1139419.1 integrin alpha [Marinicella marina]